MSSTGHTSDLVDWLHKQIADVEQTALPNLYANGEIKRTARDALAQCEAHTAILDEFARCGPRTEAHSGLRFAVQAVGLAYQHRPGYCEAWRP